MSEELRVYVADLAAYNNGCLHGVWIDATLELDEEAEEYAIHDYEGFGTYKVSKYEGLESVHEVACFLEEFGEGAGDVLLYFSDDLEDARKALEENYNGCYSSLADYAEELTTETSEVPEHLTLLHRL